MQIWRVHRQVTLTERLPLMDPQSFRCLWVRWSRCANDPPNALFSTVPTWTLSIIISRVQIPQPWHCLFNKLWICRKIYRISRSRQLAPSSPSAGESEGTPNKVAAHRFSVHHILLCTVNKFSCSEQIHISCSWICIWQLHKHYAIICTCFRGCWPLSGWP